MLALAGGCANAPFIEPAPDLEARLAVLHDRLSKIWREQLEALPRFELDRLPRVERWSQEAFRRYLLERWEREWPRAIAEHEERILVALELWPRDLDYRDETLRVSVEETVAAYLEDRDTIAVLSQEEVRDSTLIHELTHALQEQRWGSLETPRTFEGQFVQTNWLEREATRAEALARGESGRSSWDAWSFPNARPPAHYWLNEEPALAPVLDPTPLGFGGSGKQARTRLRGWGKGRLGPRGPETMADRPLGPVTSSDQVIGRRGAMWWAAQVLGEWQGRYWNAAYLEGSSWWVDDRLQLLEDEIVWRIQCRGWAGILAEKVRRARPKFTVSREDSVVVIRIPLPGRGWDSAPR